MSHFSGFLRKPQQRAGADPCAEDAVKKRVLAAMSRSEGNPPVIVGDDSIWIAVQIVTPWGNDPRVQRLDGIGVVAGDPVWVHDEQSARCTDSCHEVAAALLAGRPEALVNTRGMFAAVGWNPAAQRLMLATDKLANRCLYYKDEPDRLLFATSLRLLRLLCVEEEQVDEQGFAEHIFFAQALGARTVFRGIRVLTPGEVATSERAGPFQSKIYFDYCRLPRMSIGRADAEALLHRRFSQAVSRRLSGDHQGAFLSGGMDSRAVVAELVDQNQLVDTFCAAFPESIDDVVGSLVARRFGTRHHTWHRTPAARVLVALDPFAVYARQNFPMVASNPSTVHRLWSGDGGSVMLGHVYMNAARVQMAQAAPTADLVLKLFPTLATRPTRHLSKRQMAHFAEMAVEGARQELERVAASEPDRRLFHFYARNDQCRHLYHHFESLDLSKIELLTPFFDSDFVSLVASLPIEWFLGHKLYNSWIQGFRCGAGELYWQPYPGHEGCPHPNPASTEDQWSQRWFDGPEVRQTQVALARELGRRNDRLALRYVRRPLLRMASLMNRLGSTRYNYEIAFARNIIQTFGDAR